MLPKSAALRNRPQGDARKVLGTAWPPSCNLLSHMQQKIGNSPYRETDVDLGNTPSRRDPVSFPTRFHNTFRQKCRTRRRSGTRAINRDSEGMLSAMTRLAIYCRAVYSRTAFSQSLLARLFSRRPDLDGNFSFQTHPAERCNCFFPLAKARCHDDESLSFQTLEAARQGPSSCVV